MCLQWSSIEGHDLLQHMKLWLDLEQLPFLGRGIAVQRTEPLLTSMNA